MMIKSSAWLAGNGVVDEWLKMSAWIAEAYGYTPRGYPPEAALTGIANTAGPADIIIAPIPDGKNTLAELLQFPIEHGRDTILTRNIQSRKPAKIVIASGGGSHTLKAISLGGKLTQAWESQVEILRVVRPVPELHGELWQLHLDDINETMLLQCRMQQVNAKVTVVIHENVPACIDNHLHKDDLLIIGGPGNWRLKRDTETAMPFEILSCSNNPALLVLSPPEPEIALNDIFWAETIRLHLKPADKWDAIRILVQTLVDEKQIPESMKEAVLMAANEREHAKPTSVSNSIAVPHAALPGFPGIAGCLGICPEGVLFNENDAEPVHFLFLIISPQEEYGRYLLVLSQLARVMHTPERRRAILQCTTPTQVSEIFTKTLADNSTPAP